MCQNDKRHLQGIAYVDDHIQSVLAQPILDAEDNTMGESSIRFCVVLYSFCFIFKNGYLG